MGQGLFKQTVKAAAMFFVVGAALALSAPLIAMAVGLADPGLRVGAYKAAASMLGHSANPAWLGSFFGMFGALDAVARPFFNKLFRDEPAKPANDKAPQVIIAVAPPEPEKSASKYRDAVQASRTQQPSSQPTLRH